MATVSTTATFTPVHEWFTTPMRPDNTPVQRNAPMGRIRWPGSVLVPEKVTTNVSELTVSLTVPTGWTYRFINLSWSMLITDPAAIADMNVWEDAALMTIPRLVPAMSMQLVLRKNASASVFTVTTPFVAEDLVPDPQIGYSGVMEDIDTPIIFRAVDNSAQSTAATTFQSMVEAFIYTVEQNRQTFVHTPQPVSGNF